LISSDRIHSTLLSGGLPSDKLILSVLTTRLKKISNRSTAQLQSVIRIFKPGTVLRWQKTTCSPQMDPQKKGGRPPFDNELVKLIREKTSGRLADTLVLLRFLRKFSSVKFSPVKFSS